MPQGWFEIPFGIENSGLLCWVAAYEGVVIGPTDPEAAFLARAKRQDALFTLMFEFKFVVTPELIGKYPSLTFDQAQLSLMGRRRALDITKSTLIAGDTLTVHYDLSAFDHATPLASYPRLEEQHGPYLIPPRD